MNVGKPTNLTDVLVAMRDQVSVTTGIPPEYVIPTLTESLFRPGFVERYVLITNFAGAVNDQMFEGAGQHGTTYYCSVDVVLLARLDVDHSGTDISRLTDATLGVLSMWRLVQKAIVGWMPTDGSPSPTGILIQPAEPAGFSVSPREFGDTGGWTEVRTRLSFAYRQDLS